MRLRTKTKPAFYVHELRGVIYVSWVSEKNKDRALNFLNIKIGEWQKILSDMTGFDLEIDTES